MNIVADMMTISQWVEANPSGQWRVVEVVDGEVLEVYAGVEEVAQSFLDNLNAYQGGKTLFGVLNPAGELVRTRELGGLG